MANVINRNRRKAAIFLLFLFIVFSISSYQQQAEAIAPVAAAAGAVGILVVGYVLITAGIVFAEGGDFRDVAERCYNDIKPIVDAVVAAGTIIWDFETNKPYYIANAAGALWDAVKGWADTEYDVGINYSGGIITLSEGEFHPFTYDQVCEATMTGTLTKARFYFQDGKLWRDRFYSNGNLFDHTNFLTLNSNYTYMLKVHYGTGLGDSIYYLGHMVDSTWIQDYGGGVGAYMVTNWSLTVPEVATGITGQEGVLDNPTWDWHYPGTLDKPIDIPLVGSPGAENPDFTYSNSKGDQVGLNVDANAWNDGVGKTADQVIGSVKTVTDGVQVQDVSIPDTAVADYPIAQQTPVDETEKSLKFLLVSKFPFCLPWDLVNGIRLLAANPQVPKWEVDLFTPMGFSGGKFVIDMADYEVVGTVIRWTCTVEFCLMLILVTRKIIWG